jgi:hypothetical protein
MVVAKRQLPGRQEIAVWLDGWLDRYGTMGDPFALTPDQLFMLVGSNLGWDWNVEDVGRAPCRHTGEPNALEGMYRFLAERMAAKKAARKDAP